jgi:hypothetical protein
MNITGLDVDKVIASASEEARANGLLNIIFLEADNGNYMSLVVGGDETVLGFNYGHQDPPYYASKGRNKSDKPVMTAYMYPDHHTEFPRKWVIPMKEGLLAVREFCETGELPSCIEWTEV